MKTGNRNKFYRMKYCICGPQGYWWQERKLIHADDVDNNKNYSTHRWFRTIKLARRACVNVPAGSILTRFVRHNKNGHEVYDWEIL